MTFADPVSRNRPGDRSASTADLIASASPGARCTSSITAGAAPPASPATKPSGSPAAAARAAAESSDR